MEDNLPSIAERMRLVRAWHPGSFPTLRRSLIKHLEKHGRKLGAKDLWQYLRQAEEFNRNLKGVHPYHVAGDTPGVQRYRKLGKYIDKVPDGRIISYGLV